MNFRNFLNECKSVEITGLKESVLSMRIQLDKLNTKDLDNLEKKIRTVASSITPVNQDDVEAFYDGDKKHIRININNVPSRLFNEVKKEIEKLASR